MREPAAQQGEAINRSREGEKANGPQAGTPIGMPGLKARGALLSLSLDLEAPAGTRSQEFSTLAAADGEAVPALDVSYASRSFREVIVLILAAGLALLMWWLRHASVKTKLALVLATIVVPIALTPITPAWATMLMEGLLLGGIVGVLLWTMLALVRWLVACCERWCSPGWTVTTPAKTTTGLILVACLLGGSGSAIAQDAKSSPPANPPVAAVSAEQDANTLPNGGTADTAVAPKLTDQLPTVVLPYDGDDPLAAERVYLPQALFRELWLKVHPQQRRPAQAPVDGLVAESLYSIDVTGEAAAANSKGEAQVRVRGRFVLFGFRDSPVWLPLPLDQVAIASATIDEAEAALRPGEKGQPQVLIETPGVHVLDVEFDVPAELRAASGQFTLPLRPVASGSLSVTLPATDAERAIRINSDVQQNIGSRIRTEDDGRRRLSVAVDQGGPLRVAWQPKATRGDSDNIIHVTSRTAVDIADDGVQIVADYELQVRQGTLAEVPFSFPEAVRLKRITGADVGGWQIDGEGDERTLTIFLRRNVSDNTLITAELFLPQEDRSDEFDVAVPAFAPQGVTRETGDVTVLSGSHLDVRATATEGLRQVDRTAAKLPQSMNSKTGNIQLAYRFVARPWTLGLSVRPEPPKVTATAEHAVLVGHRRTTYGSRFRFGLTGAPRQTLTVDLPEEFLLTSVLGDGIEDWFVESSDLVIDFGQPRTGRVEVVLEGHLPRVPTDPSASIITPLPLDLDTQQSVLAVWVDPMYSATLDSFDTWRTIDRAELSGDLRGLHSGDAQFAFRSSSAIPEIINLNLIRQQPQIVADAVALMAVSDVSVDYGLTLRWTIERAATDTLVFTVPDWLEDRLELTGNAIRQTTQTTTDAGRIRWTVQLTDAVRGEYLLSAIATLPPPEDGQVRAPDVVFEQPPLTPDGQNVPIDAQQSFAVLVNLSRGRLSPTEDVNALTVRREQLPLVLRNDLLAQAMAIVRLPKEVEVAWTLERVTEQQIQAAQVTAAELTSVLAMDGSVRTLAQYRIRNRGQQFLALRLPESTRLLSVLVKGSPARALDAQIGEQPVTLVPLPQTSAADLSFLVQVVLTGRLSGIRRLDEATLGREVDIPVPVVISPLQSPEYGMPVVNTSWTVHLPDELTAEAVPSSTNVSVQRAAAAEAMIELQLYRELDELSRLVISKDVTEAQRRKAISNVDALQRNLSYFARDETQSDLSYESLSVEDRDFADKKEQLLEESRQNVQQAQQLYDFSAPIAENAPVDANALGRNYIIGNTMSIVTDNSGNGVVSSGEMLKGFSVERFGKSPGASREVDG